MLHLLCFAPHPDDGEIHVGGILTKHSMKYNVGLIDLTKGEKSSNGSVRRRTSESDKASEIMGLHTRINLEIDDTKINHLSEEQLVKSYKM